MNPNRAPDLSPRSLVSATIANRKLIWQLAKREIIARYRGSFAGVAWSFLNPLLMLVVYSFVFSVVFKARWGVDVSENRGSFALILFVGLLVHAFFAECINRAPTLILSNVSYVKRVVFPLETLPWVALLSSLFHGFVSVIVLLAVQVLIGHKLPWTALLFPVCLLPLALTTAALSYILAALGVYLRDIAQLTVMFTTVLFFLSPVVYPVSALPAQFQVWMRCSPLTIAIEDARALLLDGRVPDPMPWVVYLAISFVLLCFAYAAFQKMRRGFADVL
ncbi:ABC transporter permease [Lysobacter sp. HA35]